jgi:hypothetical protein
MPKTHCSRTRRLIALGIVGCLALVAAAPARGGAYRAALCNPDLGARHADATFERSSIHFRSRASCDVGGDGLGISHHAGSRGGSWGAWIVSAPHGTVISRLSVSAADRAGGGNVPELLRGPRGSLKMFAAPSAGLGRFRWSSAPTRGFAARLRCRRISACSRGRRAWIRVKRLALLLDDRVDPTLGLDGSLFAPGSRRGNQAVAPSAADVGGGVRRFLLQVNGEPVTAHTVSCRLADRIATRLRPCRRRASASFAAVTASSPFRQGPNVVRVCAADYTASTAANRTCARRRVRVDNLCPISKVARGAALRARVRRDGRGAIVTGRLLDRRGRGVWSARVCVATLVRLPGLAELVAAAPLTDADGRFRTTIPSGPSREVRIAYWASTATAVERYRHLDVPARPRLRLRPNHPIANGDRIRFRVRLPGPANGRRRVRIQVRTGHRRWLQLREGLTAAGGIYRARYRFHATTGRQTYAFRALVPKQEGYPYESGRSRVKRATVIG